MKKFTTLLLCMLLIFTLTACKDKENKEAETEPETSTTVATQTTEEDTTEAETTAPEETAAEPEPTPTTPAVETPPSDSAENNQDENQNDAPSIPTYTPPDDPTPTEPPQTVCNHANTYIKDEKVPTETSEGYSGDMYCSDCGQLIGTGEILPIFVPTYTIENPETGKNFTYTKGEDIFLRTLKEKNRTATHQFPTVEKEILRLTNIERQKAGLSPVEWVEEAYYYAKIRAEECHTLFSHQRPDATKWSTVYSNDDVCCLDYGENIAEVYSDDASELELAKIIVDSWMNSPGHRANILYPDYKYLIVAVAEKDTKWEFVQNFFGSGVID